MMGRLDWVWRAGFGVWAIIGVTGAWGAESTTQPAETGAVRGVVSAESEIPMAEMVVFLDVPEGVAAPAVGSGEAVRVSQKGAQFEPRITIVPVGRAVEFLNDEDRPIEHNVFSNSPAKRFDLGLWGPGKSKVVTFDKAGPVFLYCSIHRY